MVRWHHQLDEHEFEQSLGVGDRQGSLACCSPWGPKVSDTTEQLNWSDFIDVASRPLVLCCHRGKLIHGYPEIYVASNVLLGFLVAQIVNNLPAVQKSPGLIPGSGSSPRVGNGYPLQYSCLESSMNSGAWWDTARGVTKSKTQLNNYCYIINML